MRSVTDTEVKCVYDVNVFFSSCICQIQFGCHRISVVPLECLRPLCNNDDKNALIFLKVHCPDSKRDKRTMTNTKSRSYLYNEHCAS